MGSTHASGASAPSTRDSPGSPLRRPPRAAHPRRARVPGLVVLVAMSACTGILGLDGLDLVRPPPSKPGFDLTAGGNVSTSPKYRLVGTLGESPGGNVVGKSASYTLYGGVVAAAR